MSFLGGAECSTSSNPLSQFSKHTQDDRSLQRDRLLGPGPGRVQESFRSRPNGGSQEQMMQNFLHQNGQLPQEPSVDAFAMEQTRRDLDGFRMRSPVTKNGNWSADFRHHESTPWSKQLPQTQQPAFSTQEFRSFHMSPATISQAHDDHHLLEQATKESRQLPKEQYANDSFASHFQIPQQVAGMSPPLQDYQLQLMLLEQQSKKRLFFARQEQNEVATKPNPPSEESRMVELDDGEWEKQFDELNALPHEETDEDARQAMERELDQMDRSVPQHSETNLGDLESIWRGIQAEAGSNRTINGLQDGQPLGLHMPDDILNDINTWDAFDGQFTEPVRDPQFANYMFEEENPYSGTADPYHEGLKIVEEGGNLSLAALAFEAAVQRSPEHADAWAHLGSAQAQNEKETPAIRALTQCLRLDETNLGALMGLAISHINEGYDTTAFRTLERWLSTKYPQVVPASDLSPDTELGYTDRHQLHEKVTDMFIQAAQLSPGGEQMDPDVQVGLGVLFYGAEEYAKAVDCFEAALASTEEGTSNSSGQAHLLWNRLGATLANSGRSEEAITAYEKALTLNPNFVRARYNLGVSCINIGVFEQAAQHLLGALNMHRVVELEGMQRVKEVVGENVENDEVERLVAMNQSTNLLETLRRVFQSMGRRDLAEKVVSGMDVETFRGDFDF